MRQMQDQLDRAFTGLWGGSSGSSWTPETVFGPSDWAPAIDVFQRGNDLVEIKEGAPEQKSSQLNQKT
jgi:hypothetical protein